MGAPTGHWKASANGGNWLSPPRTRNLDGAGVSESTEDTGTKVCQYVYFCTSKASKLSVPADLRRCTEHHVCAKDVKKTRFSRRVRGCFSVKAWSLKILVYAALSY